MSRFLYRLGRSSARHPWRVVGAWLIIALAVFSLRSAVGGETTDDFALPGTETQTATDLLQDSFPAQSGASGQIVFHAGGAPLTDPGPRADIAATVAALDALDQVVVVTDPFDPSQQSLSPDGTTGFATVTFTEQTLQAADFEAVDEAVGVGRDAGLQVEISGSIAQASEEVEGTEGIGLAVAVIVLLVAFGSVVAMGIPIGTALFGVAIGLAGVGVLAGFADVPSVSPMLATMIGLGVGIDYALFVVTRHRQFLEDGLPVVEAAGRANATAGQSVLFAGATVVIAISGLVGLRHPVGGHDGLRFGDPRRRLDVRRRDAAARVPRHLRRLDRPVERRPSPFGDDDRIDVRPVAGRTTSAVVHGATRSVASSPSLRSPRRSCRCASRSPTTATHLLRQPSARRTTCSPMASAPASTDRSRSSSTVPTRLR